MLTTMLTNKLQNKLPTRLITLLGMAALCGASHAAEVTDSPASVNLMKITLSLLLIVGLMIGFAVLAKKFGLNRIQGSSLPVKVIGAISIGTNQRLVVIEVGEEWLLLGVTPQQITTITSMPRQETPAAAVPGQQFSSWMQSALEKYNAKKP